MEQQASIEISLDQINLSTTNEMFRRPAELTEESLGDLRDSIIQFGVIQPVLVRPDKAQEGKFILICGERRYCASQLAGKSTIPVHIKDVNDEVALILQITENMQREDVHPLNEATGYRVLLEADATLTTAALALKFGKSETFILQRLKLNDLVRECKKDFYAGKMQLGHAVILARLSPKNQRAAIDRLVSDNRTYGTISQFQDFVDRQVTTNLTQAPFDINDETIHTKAGSCIACPKRTGASPLLFPEIRDKDMCMDRGCFFMKCEKFLIRQTKEFIETQPDVVFLTNWNGVPEKVERLLEEHKIKPIKEYDDFTTQNHGGAKVKGFWISGDRAGTTSTVFLSKRTTSAKIDDGSPKTLVEKIRQRMTRSRELDGEKVYAKILECLKTHPTQKAPGNVKMLKDEELFLWFIVFNKASYHIKHDLIKQLKLNDDKPEKLYQALAKLKPDQKTYMLRRVMLDQFGGNYPESDYGYLVRKIAEGYGDIDIKSFEKEQEEIRTKREERAKQRISQLKKIT